MQIFGANNSSEIEFFLSPNNFCQQHKSAPAGSGINFISTRHHWPIFVVGWVPVTIQFWYKFVYITYILGIYSANFLATSSFLFYFRVSLLLLFYFRFLSIWAEASETNLLLSFYPLILSVCDKLIVFLAFQCSNSTSDTISRTSSKWYS